MEAERILAQMNKKLIFLFFFFVFWNLNGLAQSDKKNITVIFEDLPEETVVPILDDPKAIRSKLVSVKSRWFVDIDGLFDLDEPFQNNLGAGLAIGYFYDDQNAWGFRLNKHFAGLRDYGQQFEASSSQLRFNRAPFADYEALLQYDMQLLYGKISFSKEVVMPVSGRFGSWLGMGKFTDERTLFSSGAFARASLFFTSKMALGITFRGMLKQIPNVLSVGIRQTDSIPSMSSFSDRWDFSYHLDIGISYLF